MQILKIDSTNFQGKFIKGTKIVPNKVLDKPEIGKIYEGLTVIGTINLTISGLKNDKKKSYEKTLEKNFFQLPAGASPDVFQKASAAYLYNENDVLVTAPTGTGKTAIAHYVITKNLQEGKKTFYTTPLKALSNEKFRSFQKTYGEENVGLITGDTKINKDAPIVIMTTEVYRNMIFGDQFKEHNSILDNLKTVVFDELHYLGDVDRGGVWEQSIIFSDPKTQLLSLSATIGNNIDIAKWMSKSRELSYHRPLVSTDERFKSNFDSIKRVPKNTVGLINVPSENRHVPLVFENTMVSGTKIVTSKVKPNKVQQTSEKPSLKPRSPIGDDYRTMVSNLKKEDKLPAIFFIFSKKICKNTLDHLAHYGAKLNTEEDIQQIREIIEKYKSEGKYLGETLNIKALEKGYAIHNSGLLPNQKELVEELFQKKLVKVVLATETLSAGINMPARTTVISSYIKPSSNPTDINGFRELTPNEFHQMAGRAGRRGIDKIGYCYTMSMDPEQKAVFDRLIQSEPNELKSAFGNPDYSFVAGYYDTCESDELIREIAARSFFTYDEREHVSLAKQKEFMKSFGLKRKILRKFDYLDSNHGLNGKGKLLTKLNGYEQIPIINAIDSKRLGGLSPVELAAAIGGFANLQLHYERKKDGKNVNEIKPFHHKNEILDSFITNETNKINQYNSELSKLDSTHRNIEFNQNAIHHIYNWANSNSVNENSTDNWARIIKTSEAYPIKDEGTLFKEIAMTIDLLKQITEICDEGINISANDYEKRYYDDLKTTAQESIILLSKEPIV